MAGELPTEDEFFGAASAAPPPQPSADLPSEDEFLDPPSFARRLQFGLVPFTMTREQRAIVLLDSQAATHRMMDAIGYGFKQGFGEQPLTELTPDEEKVLKAMGWSQDEGYHVQKAFAEAIIRPSIIAGNTAVRGLGALFGAFQHGVMQLGVEAGQPELARDIAAMPEAFMGSPFGVRQLGGLPHIMSPREVIRSRSIGVVGEGEKGYYDAVELTPDNAQARVTAAQEMGEEPVAPLPATQDVHVLVRRIEPQAFEQYDALEAQKIIHRESLHALAAEREALPETVQAQSDIAEILGKVHGVEDRLTKAQAERLADAKARLDRALTRDTPTMAASRQSLLEADYAQRDLAPSIASAYRQARELLPESQVNQIEAVQEASRVKPPGAFTPTSEWQPIPPDAILPPGLEIQMDLATGKNRARIPPGLATAAPVEPEATRLAREGYLKPEIDGAVATEPVPGQPVEGAVSADTGAPKPRTTTNLRPIEGTGGLQTRTLAEGVEAKAIENQLTDNFGDLPEYHELNMEDQANNAAAFLNKDYEAAKAVALGLKQPPRNLVPESVFVAVEKRAIAEGDVELLHRLATESKLTTAATTMGQRIRTLRERDPNSPIAAIQEVQEARAKALAERSKTAIEDTVKEARAEIKKTAPTRDDWANFISSITCVEE